MNETQARTATEMRPIRDLLPERPSEKQPGSEAPSGPSWFTPEERASARQASIRRHLSDGWALGNDGRLVKGEGKAKIEARPTELMPSKCGEPDFNPAVDAFALRLGAVFVGPNRYRMANGLLVDANGACRDEKECPECGSLHGEYRFQVPEFDPDLKTWERGRTYCRRCCSEDEIRAIVSPVTTQPRKTRQGSH